MRLSKIEGEFQPSPDQKCAIGARGMVATAFPDATAAGVEALEAGGNAVDAACAAALALTVCEPQASGICGQTMAIIHVEGKTIAIDGSSRVPSLAHLSQFDKGERLNGHRATTVPSTIAVLGYLNFKYGHLPWESVVAPAERIARKGYQITELQSRLLHRELKHFHSVENLSGARYFLKDGKVPFEPGEVFKQPHLADTLEYLMKKGPRGFYQGELARAMDEDMKKHGGFLRYDDLALIPWPVERQPLSRNYRKARVATLPPPAAGRTLLLVLMMLNHLSSKFLRERSPASYHYMAETFRKAFLSRRDRPFDPNTYPQVHDEKRLLTREYARTQSQSIRETMDPSLPWVDPYSDGETTHLSVMDEQGNAVGITQSIERVHGSHAAADGLGFMYNNYMSALETKDPSHPYYLRPGAVPWTSVAPAIVFHNKKPWIVTGSPGSERIFSSVAQFLSHMLDRNRPMSEAMLHPRFHCSIGGTINIEAERFPPEVIAYLKEEGYKIKEREPYCFYLGAIHAVMKCQTREGFQGVAEIRRDGTAGGPN